MLTPEVLTQFKTLLDLGLSGLLLYFLFVIYKEKKEERDYSRNLNKDLRDAYVENTKVMEKTTAVSERAVTISEKVLEILQSMQNK